MLHLGDALGSEGLASLEEGAVDVTICDPPFDERTHRAALEVGNWRDGGRAVGGALPFAPFGAGEIDAAARHLARVTRRWIVVFTSERQTWAWIAALEAGGARFVRTGIAERANPRPQMSGDRPAPSCDFLVICHGGGAGRMKWNGGGRPAVWRSPAARFDTGGEQLHPCQKPLTLMRALVEDFTAPGELVLDPFLGAGSTAVACKQTGRRFLGWEADPRFHAIALRRVAAAREQLGLAFEAEL